MFLFVFEEVKFTVLQVLKMCCKWNCYNNSHQNCDITSHNCDCIAQYDVHSVQQLQLYTLLFKSLGLVRFWLKSRRLS